MPAYRFPHAIALGKVGNFQARSDGLFSSTDTTPDVAAGSLFYSNNASATSITHFDNAEQGQLIKVLCLDGVTTLVNSSVLRLKDGQDVTAPTGSAWGFVYHNSTWFETYRSYNTANQITITSANVVGTAGQLTISPAVSNVLVLGQAASLLTIKQMLGGYTGQMVTLLATASNVTLLTNSAGLSDGFRVKTVSGTSAIIHSTGQVLFTRAVLGGTAMWVEVVPVSAGS